MIRRGLRMIRWLAEKCGTSPRATASTSAWTWAAVSYQARAGARDDLRLPFGTHWSKRLKARISVPAIDTRSRLQ